MKNVLIALCFLLPASSFAQVDSSFLLKIKQAETADFLKTDTLAVPEDALTQKIRQLRKEKNGIDIEMVLQIKIREEQERDTVHGKDYYDRLLTEITTGNTSKLLNNALINMYRQTFTEPEIDDLLRFYKTSAGKKMNSDYILLIIRSVKDAEGLMRLIQN
ncbi:MAG: DUF2059 domain-containing protein [Terrimonas ferruginea]|uniref:DUF2059 domain-containing protein n=1 Tax=Terrimonas ferruginea TaxID=249 RepID=UPI000AACA933|nr:DUF2059 domain-containing protein [Terrimonas ferruginea]MBN8783038.1 DUF2059 domain-containing protein [Terrimonas ferruginea]